MPSDRATRLRSYFLPFVVLLLLLAAPAVRADEGAADPDPAGAKEAPKTFVVARRPFAVTLDLKGTLVPNAATEVAYVPEVYGGTLEVVEAFLGGPVVAGQTLVRFEEKWIQRDLHSAERDLFIARSRLVRQEADLAQKQEAAAIQRLHLERLLTRSRYKLARFRKTEKAERIAKAEHNLEGTQNRLQDEVEELDQLEKMYTADDLTEETEAIVMRRAKRNLARMRRSFEWARKRHQEFLDVSLPREEMDLELDVRRKENDHRAYLAMSEADLRRAELELAKARDAFARQEERFHELQADRDHLRLRAPSDGYAVPATFKTSWSDPAAMKRSLAAGTRFKARQALFTIVKPGDVGVAATVGEADLAKLEVGQAVEVRSGTAPKTVLTGAIRFVSPVGTGGKHAVEISLSETDAAVMPGTSAKVKVMLRVEDEALIVPSGAIRQDGSRRLLYVWKDGKAVERVVKTGDSSGGKTVILDGLEPGETVLEQPPAEEK